MAINLEQLISESGQLVSPPDVWVKMNELIHDENASASDMAGVILHDPGLTANILKVVNSAYYNLARQVDTVSRAIAIIGTNDLYNLATALTAAKVFSNIPCHLTSPEIFWSHSVATGILAKKVATKCSVLGAERLYVAGLLHDIGSLLLYSRYPELSSEVLMIANGDEEVLHQAELDIIGFSHAKVSAELLKLWNMPDALVEAIEFHHDPTHATDNKLEAAIVYLANYVANLHEGSVFMEDKGVDIAAIDTRVWEMTGLKESVIDELMVDHEQDLAVAVQVMLPKSSAA